MKNFISLKIIMDRLLRNPLLKDINFEAVIDYTLDFIQILGMPKIYVDKIAEIKINEYRGELPCDLIEIIQTSFKCGETISPMRYSTNTFKNKYHCIKSKDLTCNSIHTYAVNNGYITTNEENGCIIMSYRGLAIDENNIPMIPDNPRILRALENYIKVKYYTILFENALIPQQILQNVQQEYAWSVGAAETELQKVSLDQIQNLSNIFNKLLPSTRGHYNFYNSIGTEEYLKRQ